MNQRFKVNKYKKRIVFYGLFSFFILGGNKMNIKNPVPKIQLFNVLTVDDQRENDFYAFFYKYALMPLFTDEHRTTNITVTDNDVRSVINTGGTYHKLLKELSQLLTIQNEKDMFQEAMLKLIDTPTSFQKFMNNVKKVINHLKTVTIDNKTRIWAIVFYMDDLK